MDLCELTIYFLLMIASLLFCEENSLEWSRMMHLLDLYETASSQFLNKDKTSIFFSPNTPTDNKATTFQISCVKANSSFEKYLGLPAIVGSHKTGSFKSLLDRVWNRISNWKNMFLSTTRKKILIKAVLQALPTYTMGVSKIHKGILSELNALLKKFWWGYT